MNINDLSPSVLSYFTGTMSYTWGPFRKFVMTDGATYLAQNGCAWFLDLIASHQSKELLKKADGFQVWSLKPLAKEGKMAVAICTDGNHNELKRQEIEFTDFPFDRLADGIELFVELGSIDGKNLVWVAMLPSER